MVINRACFNFQIPKRFDQLPKTLIVFFIPHVINDWRRELKGFKSRTVAILVPVRDTSRDKRGAPPHSRPSDIFCPGLYIKPRQMVPNEPGQMIRRFWGDVAAILVSGRYTSATKDPGERPVFY